MPTPEEEFWSLMNEGEKTAEAAKTTENDTPPTGTTDPPLDNVEASPNDIDATWGQEPDRKLVPLSDVTVDSVRRGREGYLKTLFADYDKAAREAQSGVKKQFAAASSGNFASASPLLIGASKEKLSSAENETLLEQTARVTGRF